MDFQIKRWISQIIFLISANVGAFGLKTGFCYPFFYCHACPASHSACPLRAIETSVFEGSFKWKLFTYPFLILGTVGIISGRVVCGWACPIGALQRVTGKNASALKKKHPKIRNFKLVKYDKYFRYCKYLVLIGLVIITPFLIAFMFTDLCPVGMITGSFPILILNPGKYVPNSFFYIALFILILFFILILLIERGWCRYFCPVGAILAPFNKISMVQVSVNKDDCIHCNVCSNVCPMGIDVPNMHRDPECILCGKCVKVCPNNLIKFERIHL